MKNARIRKKPISLTGKGKERHSDSTEKDQCYLINKVNVGLYLLTYYYALLLCLLAPGLHAVTTKLSRREIIRLK